VSHLGDRVTALVDGQLPVEATERAHSHLAHCRECRDAVEIERLIKARLSCLDGPSPDGDLVSRLLAMGGPSGPLPPREGHVPGSPRPMAVLGRPADSRPAGRAPAGRALKPGPGGLGRIGPRPIAPSQSRRRRARLAGAVIGALTVVGAGVGGLVIAAPAVRAPGPGSPVLDSFVVQRANNTGRLPFAEQSSGWQIESVLATPGPRGRADSLGDR
jgi:hypothetical protein